MIDLPGFVQAENDEETRRAIKYSLTREASNYLTICEQFRFIYDSVYLLPDSDLKENIIEKLVDGFNMGKKMNSRLAHYKRLNNDKTGSAGANLILLNETKTREHMRRNRP